MWKRLLRAFIGKSAEDTPKAEPKAETKSVAETKAFALPSVVIPSERAKRSRGYRNKNPGNIDWLPPGRAWNGQIGKEPGGRFGVYESHELGIRAIGKQLLKYQESDDLHTIRQMINRWAPPVENATNNYIARVDAMMTRHGADDRLNLREYLQLRVLVEAIIVVECGGNPYQPDVIDRGVRLALA